MRRLKMRTRWVSLVAGLFAILALPACSTEGPPLVVDAGLPPPPPDLAEPPPDPPPPEPARYILLRSVRWPGGGRELTLGVLNARTERPFAADLSARIGVVPQGGFGAKLAAARRVPAPGYTALLLPPSRTETQRAALAEAVLDFAAARPAERIALYRHGAEVQLFSGYLQDRAELGEALARYRDGTDDEAPLPLGQAMQLVTTELRQVGGEGPDVMRALIVLAGDPAAVDPRSADVFIAGAAPDAAGLAAAGKAIEEVRTSAFYRVSVCSRPEKFEGALRIADLHGELKASFPATLPEEVEAACDVAAIDSAKRTFTPRIELIFDEAQRAAHDERIRATQKATFNEELAKSDFTTQVRLAPGQPAILATAHLRGNGTLSCERKSYTLQLTGPARHLLPDSASDEFYLISMCDDRAYMYSSTAYDLFNGDLFSLRHRLVEFVIDGKSKGIYRLMEKAREGIVRDHARVSTVMRRDYPSETEDIFEVAYPTTGDLTAPVTRYAEFAAQIAPLEGDALIEALRGKLDLDLYLRWLASQSILQSGDYVDEAYFIGVEQADGKGQIGEAYRVMPWDPEGYTACHGGGKMAYVDPHQMVYCAESRLDHKLLADPKVYALFVAKLEEAMDGALAPGRVAAALARTRDALQARLTDPTICAAMIELRSLDSRYADCAVARGLIAARADALRTAYDNRRALLIDKIAVYRAGL